MIHQQTKTNYYLLIAIMVFAVFFWSWQVWSRDILGDEVGYAFRSIGYLDYLGTSFQTTPVEWYNNLALPWWTHLSFHDHPPLFFIIQNIFFRILGDSVFVARIPAFLAGLISLWLLYLVVRRFGGEKSALVVTVWLAINAGIVALFRSSLIEPVLLALVLFSIWAFFRFVDDERRFIIFGLSLGLMALTKYIGVFILPVYIFYLAIKKRAIFRNPRLYLAILLALILFSPVIVYNFYLYREFGHFDLQLAYLFHQKTPEWTAQAGKYQEPFRNILPNLLLFYGPTALGLVILGFILGVYYVVKLGKSMSSPLRGGIIFGLLYLIFVTLLLIFIGSGYRFLGLYAPVFFVLAAIPVYKAWFDFGPRPVFRVLVIMLIASELFYAIKINFINANDFGLVKLDNYFNEEFRGRISGAIPQTENTHLNDVIAGFTKNVSGMSRHLSVIVYNDNVDISTVLWIFTRKFFYEGIPTMYVENFRRVIAAQGLEAFKGFDIYFVQSTPQTLLNPLRSENVAAENFEKELVARGMAPVKKILGKNGREMFRIYKFRI